ncbi:folate transporter, putative [Trypanosoma brucei brucei TREU927]|uniref:Folate transporter, putative n=1 Tax=Trypanosoma brucei brucei (strain 927/4 GUTat10.1) TaxID=185431 RepID=Q580Y5_TRYB2|nr:folate transporter, putative [Trypanosoma brucei brucei TREU927]AAX78968.1 folate transporter, putative [Trypanosoma brucei]AAZ13130.1 folate transporter, putative [Trypanosoma brucei brucei TREU927]
MTTSPNACQDQPPQHSAPQAHEAECTTHKLSAEETMDARPVHPDARALFRKLPCVWSIPVFGTAVEAFGPKFVFALGFCELFGKGIADNIIRSSLFPMFTYTFGADAKLYQRMSSLVTFGYAVKPFAAMFSDLFALFGYTRRWYLALSCVVGSTLAIVYGSLPGELSYVPVAGILVFVTSFTKANLDILTQGHYSRLIRRVPLAGPSLVSWVWWCLLVGSLVASSIVGPLTDKRLQRVAVFISAGMQLVPTIFFMLNWYGERKNREERAYDLKIIREKKLEHEADAVRLQGSEATSGSLDNPSDTEEVGEGGARILPCCCGAFEVNREVFARNKKVVFYCMLLTLGAIGMVLVTVLGTRLQLLITSVVASFTLCGLGFVALPLVIAKANMFTFISRVAYIQLPGAIDNVFMATPDCFPGGPNFSYFYYSTVGNMIGAVGGVIGVTLFRYVFSKRSYRLTFIVTTLIEIVSSIFDIIIVERWNRPYVSDHVVFVLGDQIIHQVCYMMHFMPTVMLISRLCPRGSESMVYALLAGFANFGRSLSNTLGWLLMEYVWNVQSDITVGPCDFSNVKWLLLLGHFGTPLINIPLVFLLIPAARICDVLDENGKAITKKAEDVHAPSNDSPRRREPTAN